MGRKGIQQQIDARGQYGGLAANRGEAGLEYAEAFAYVFRWGL